ncbi:hypothetical protein OsJ_33119 [Oryza sativa Japonica Group]|uniref:DUF4220 domain-containing protein n=1 Tax=Oryza sativa subsp. japonica TaxID=39947 RepID=A3C917_ORYSJ|nr:hypothetical protein OsJ_33119 [Oryza sativa Japonica Group]
MVDVRAVIESFFVMLKENIYVLIRIESLVALVTLIFLAMFIIDFYRCRTRSSILTTILESIDELSDQIVVYLIGAMQSARFENELFPVWAIVLVSLRTSLGYLSGYGISDRDRQFMELANVIKFIGAGVLAGTRGLKYARPLWSFWAILQLKSMYRFFAHGMANESLWHGRSSEFIPEYMRTFIPEDQETGVNHDDRNTSTMMPGKKYLICGESNKDITLKKPQYTINISNSSAQSLVTLGKIQEYNWKGMNNRDGDSKFKDLSMAFSLSRLLRCRLEDVTLNKDSINDMQHLIISEFIPDSRGQRQEEKVDGHQAVEAERTFRILELELAFVRDYFYTLYPLVFWEGLGSLCLSLLLSAATFAIAFWLAVGIRKVYQPPEGNLVLWVDGCNFDIIMTWVFMFCVMFKEIWEIVTYLVSNWTRLLVLCKYVQDQAWFVSERLTKHLVRSFFESKIGEPWHGRIDQYDFLQQITYKPTLWKLANVITLGKIKGKLDGKKTGEAIKIPQCVKLAILQAIRRIGLTSRPLPREIPSLRSYVFRSELLPDSFLVPEVLFVETLKHAREQLKDCNLKWCRYNKLMGIALQATPSSVDEKLKMNILQQGVTLAKDLIGMKDDEACWKILAEVWADLLVHIAPSWNASDHKNNLESGGEFITLIWALLWHCGIEKSSLWHKDEAFENNSQVPQESSTETRNVIPMDEPANEDGIESSEELKTRSFRRGKESRNGPKDTAKQSHGENEEKNGISSSSFRS